MEMEGYLRGDYIRNIVKEGKRLDNRKFDEYRNIEIEKGYVGEKACGSAFVKLGDTQVLAGISIGAGEPYPDSPGQGVMTTSTELRPIASPYFESGPPRQNSIELARVIDRGIRESGSIPTDKLAINDEKVWVVYIDIHILDNGGNLIDAGGIAAISALLDARMPKFEDDMIVRGEWDGKLPIECTPIPCTVAKIADQLLLDPTQDEEYAMDTRFTISTTDTINAMQKGGGFGTLTDKEVDDAVELAFSKGNEIRKLVEE